LVAALDQLAVQAAVAELDVEVARREGAAFAAAIAESAPGAAKDWADQLGLSVGAFFDAAISARRWRAAPTATLAALVEAGGWGAAGYARALAEVAASACSLGEPTMRVIANASAAAAAQLAAAGVSTAPPSTRSAPALKSSAAHPTKSLVPHPSAPALTPHPSRDHAQEDNAAIATAPGSEAEPASDQPPEKSLEVLLAELDDLIGLDKVKREIHRQAQLLRVERLREQAGLRSATITRHLVFNGNPGTGKTTVARLVAGIYRALGLLSKGHLVEVDRSELVAGFLGQTATKTAEVVAGALGGVLFIDEAYSLAGDQYGMEAIDTLVKEMEDQRDNLVVIVAGYPGPMAGFISMNPGLASRFRTTIGFEDYTDEELERIFAQLAEAADYVPTEPALTRFRELLPPPPRPEGFGNGRLARNVLEAAIGHQAWRLRDVAEPTLEQLRELLPEDLTDEDPVEPGKLKNSNTEAVSGAEPGNTASTGNTGSTSNTGDERNVGDATDVRSDTSGSKSEPAAAIEPEPEPPAEASVESTTEQGTEHAR
jgi:hypothetical protein